MKPAEPSAPSSGLSRRTLLMSAAAASAAALSMDFVIPPRSHAAITWGFPLARYVTPSYGFGMRGGRMHEGIDYPDSSGPPVFAIADGVINNVSSHANYGLFVEIEHDNGWSSFYAHLRGQSVTRGQRIGRGTQVGLMGNTGASFGVHLHLEMRTRPGGARFDPAPYVNRNSPLPGQNPPPPPPPAPSPLLEEEEMLALRITNGNRIYLAVLGPGIFRHLLATDNPEKVKNVLRIQDDWQTIDISELPVFLRTYGCDLNIWDVRGGDFAVYDPLTGDVKSGNVWTATGAIRAGIAKLA